LNRKEGTGAKTNADSVVATCISGTRNGEAKVAVPPGKISK
jgi:hypothetical protein